MYNYFTLTNNHLSVYILDEPIENIIRFEARNVNGCVHWKFWSVNFKTNSDTGEYLVVKTECVNSIIVSSKIISTYINYNNQTMEEFIKQLYQKKDGYIKLNLSGNNIPTINDPYEDNSNNK